MENYRFTEGSVVKAIIKISWPVVVANVLQAAYSIIDAFWVGRLGKEAVAAISFSSPALFLLIAFGAGISVAGNILTSQFFGKGSMRDVDYCASQTFVMSILVSLVIAAIGFIFTPFLIKIAGAGEDVFPLAVSYLRISFVGIIFVFTFFVFQGLLRGVGVVKTPMWIVTGTVILNFFLDPLFIMVAGLGVAGAAYATIITQGIASVVILWLLIKGRLTIKIRKEFLKPDWAFFKNLFSLGFPAAVEHTVRPLSFLLMVFLVSGFGTAVVASYGVVTRIINFVIIPARGVSLAATSLVGQNLGAGKPSRASKTAIICAVLSFFALLVVGVLSWVGAEEIVSFFIPGNREVIETGALFMKIISFSFCFMGLEIVFGGTFRGAGDTTSAMIITILSFIVVRVLLGWFLKGTPLMEKGIWWAFAISNFIGGVVASVWFLNGSWKKKKLLEEISPSFMDYVE